MTKALIFFVIVSVSLQVQTTGFKSGRHGSYYTTPPTPPPPTGQPPPASSWPEETPDFWRNSARVKLEEKVYQKQKCHRAQNIIFFLGDGHGVTSTSLTRILVGQEIQHVRHGEEGNLTVDNFPVAGFSRTYCKNSQVADSACAATAFCCGIKNNYGTIGVTSNVTRDDCAAGMDPVNHVQSFLKWAQDAGKATGIVTTTRVTHATPAATYAHTAERDWESDADIASFGEDPTKCNNDIAKQLILGKTGKKINVIMGGGRTKFLPNTSVDITNVTGSRLDGQNLIQIWLNQHNSGAAPGLLPAQYVETRNELLTQVNQQTKYLLGLFDSSHMQYYPNQTMHNEPTLPEMVEAAIKILSQNPYGFFLFVEGGRIDLAHHTNQALLASWEGQQFDEAIEVAQNMTNDYNTLTVVTADHSHTISFAGYAPRGSPISGFAGMGGDNIPYSITGYANGAEPPWMPFFNNQRHNISQDNTSDIFYADIPLVPIGEPDFQETHGGEDVGIFAKGPFDHLFSGVFQQNYIPWAIAYPACIGPGPTLCYDRDYKKYP